MRIDSGSNNSNNTVFANNKPKKTTYSRLLAFAEEITFFFSAKMHKVRVVLVPEIFMVLRKFKPVGKITKKRVITKRRADRLFVGTKMRDEDDNSSE